MAVPDRPWTLCQDHRVLNTGTSFAGKPRRRGTGSGSAGSVPDPAGRRRRDSQGQNRTREIRPSGIVRGPGETCSTVGLGSHAATERAALVTPTYREARLRSIPTSPLFLRVLAMCSPARPDLLAGAHRSRELPNLPKGTLPKGWQCSSFGNDPLRPRPGRNCNEIRNVRWACRRKWSPKWLQSVIKFGTVAKFLFGSAHDHPRGHANAEPRRVAFAKT